MSGRYLVGVGAAFLAVAIWLGVLAYKDATERAERIARQFVEACEAAGGKPAWNYKHWECLK